jgi:hypothetical protein
MMVPDDDMDKVVAEIEQASRKLWRPKDPHRETEVDPPEFGAERSPEQARNLPESRSPIREEVAIKGRGLSRLREGLAQKHNERPVPSRRSGAGMRRGDDDADRRPRGKSRRNREEERGTLGNTRRERKRVPAEAARPGEPRNQSDPNPPTTLQISDNVRALPGEDSNRHLDLREQVRRDYESASLYEQFLRADITSGHAQLERYERWREGRLRGLFKLDLFRALREVKPSIDKKPSTHYYKNGQPTAKALALLAEAGIDPDERFGRTVFDILETIEKMDRMISHQRAVRNDALRELELRKRERARKVQPLELEFKEVPEEDANT